LENTTATTTATETTSTASDVTSTENTASTPKSTEQQLAELQDGDFDKLIPVKDETGKVVKIKVKDLVKRTYTAESRAKKAQEAVEQRVGATVQELVAYAKTNPRDFFERIGVDPYEFSQMTLTEKVKALEMTPEQKKLAEYENELKKYKEQEKKNQEKEQLSKREIEYQKAAQSLDNELVQAFEKSGLPRNKFFFMQACALMNNDLVRYEQEMQEHGYSDKEPLNAMDALAIVKESFPLLLREALSVQDLNQVRQILGDELLTKLREDDINRVQNKVADKKPSKPNQPKKDEPKRFTSDQEYRAWVESLKR